MHLGTNISGNYELRWMCNESLCDSLWVLHMHFAFEVASLIESAVAYLQLAHLQWIALTDECSHLCIFIYIFIAAE